MKPRTTELETPAEVTTQEVKDRVRKASSGSENWSSASSCGASCSVTEPRSHAQVDLLVPRTSPELPGLFCALGWRCSVVRSYPAGSSAWRIMQMARFVPPSQKHGLRPPLPVQGRDQASKAMRQEIVNRFVSVLAPLYMSDTPYELGNVHLFFKEVWTDALGQPILTLPGTQSVTRFISGRVESLDPVGFYDWVAHVQHLTCMHDAPYWRGFGEGDQEKDNAEDAVPIFWENICNESFEAHKASWRFIDGELYPATDPREIEALEKASSDVQSSDKLKEVASQYHNSWDRFKDGDYGNAGANAIHSLETLVKLVLNKPAATLGANSEKMISNAKVHPILGGILSKLYGLTSDGPYRHGLKPGQSTATEAETRLIIVMVSGYLSLLIPIFKEQGKL